MQFARSGDVDLLILRCRSPRLRLRRIGTCRCFLAARGLLSRPTSGFTASRLSWMHPPWPRGDRRLGRNCARVVYRIFSGHYHADPRLDPVRCHEGYVQWPARPDDAASLVLVSETGAACRASSRPRSSTRKPGRFLLNGVAPSSAQRDLRGVVFARSDAARAARRQRGPGLNQWRTSRRRRSGPAPASNSTRALTPSHWWKA